MKKLHVYNSDNYGYLAAAEEDGAVSVALLPEGATPEMVREIIELCGIVHNGDPAHFTAVIETSTFTTV